MVLKNALKWLFSNQATTSKENFDLFITKFSYLANRIFLKIFKSGSFHEDLPCYISHPIIIKNKHGFLASVYDGFSLITFTRDHEPQVLEKIKLKDNLVFLDVGASLGFYSLFAAQNSSDGLIISIEPDKELYEKILENLKINNFDNVECINCAVSDVDRKKIKLFKGMNSTIFGSGENFSLVESRTIDSIVSEHQLSQIDWMKIDVESAEVMALKGAKKSLEITKNLILEIHSKKNGAECLKILENQGFEIKLIKKLENSNKNPPHEILQQMEDLKGNVIFYPIFIAKNKKFNF